MAADDTFRLMRKLEVRFGLARAIPAPRAALGLLAVLQLWRNGRSDCKVALPSALCHEVVLAVLAAGCQPVFCDVDADCGLIPLAEWRRARALGAEVAIAVHLYGNPVLMQPIREIFPAGSCLLVDDAAQALGSLTSEGQAGALGDVGLLSFGLTKHIPLGDAALMFRDAAFAAAVSDRLTVYPVVDNARRGALIGSFRARLEAARMDLRERNDTSLFAGLLEGMEPVLYKGTTPGADTRVMAALEDYDLQAQQRVQKAGLWAAGLRGTPFKAVGMGAGVVPWRYACRWPRLDWKAQHRLAASMREAGLHVSNWYLPVHWFLGSPPGTLPGTEMLALEVFQFWVNEEMTEDRIRVQAALVCELTRHQDNGAQA